MRVKKTCSPFSNFSAVFNPQTIGYMNGCLKICTMATNKSFYFQFPIIFTSARLLVQCWPWRHFHSVAGTLQKK